MLPADARQTYEREGWLVVPQLLPKARVDELRVASQALELAGAALERDQRVEGVTYELQSVTGKRGDPALAPGAFRKVTFPSKRQRAFQVLRTDPALLASLEALGLGEPHCIVDQVNFKLPRVGSAFPYHQDAKFVVGALQGKVERFGGINLVIALDPADAGNGTFEVLGRTHTSGLVDFPYDFRSMNHGVFDESRRAVLVLRPGDAVFFHPHLAHGSGPNTSDRPRRLVTLWFAGGGKVVRPRSRAGSASP
jgi:hypothetical protein